MGQHRTATDGTWNRRRETLSHDFDPADLDWSRHATPRDGRELGDGVFLAEAGARVGEAMIEHWLGSEGVALSTSERPAGDDLPAVHDAFDGLRPVERVHRAFGPLVRAVISPAAYADLASRRDNRAAWTRSCVPDPDGGPPIGVAALRARNGEDADDPIVRDHWQCAVEMTTWARACRRRDASKMAAVARAIAEMAIAGAILMRGRPIAGGASVDLDANVWHTGPEQRIRRFASCSLNLAAPHDPAARHDHLLFVAEDGLDEAIRAYAAANGVPDPVLASELAALDDARTGRMPRLAALEDMVDAILRQELSVPGRENWRLEDCQTVIEQTGNPRLQNMRPLVERLKRDFRFLGQRGQPTPHGRPSLLRKGRG